MTGRRLYEKITDAQKFHERGRYDRERGWVRTQPSTAPVAWAFLSAHEKDVYNTVAQTVDTKPRRKHA